VIQIQRTGNGFYKARYEGCSNFTFGATPEEACQRLDKIPSRNCKKNAAIAKRNLALGFKEN
jgi:hypothetical protein